MAMLAEPRQRKRYNLVPKGKPLFDDGDRFGTKMLEKMGWSKGKGLGSREDGNQDFVRVKYKKDVGGFGFEERDDQWTEHEKQFNGLLENLNGGEDSTNNSLPDDCEIIQPAVGLGFVSKSSSKKKLKDKLSGHSLEEKSKNSKARVHYKKFTKGKDMAQYSEKDLANIFGKKATAEDENIYNQFQAFASVGATEKKEEKVLKEPPKENDAHLTINTGISVSDYFKMKMAALKQKQSGNASENIETIERPPEASDVPSRNKRKAEEFAESQSEEVPRKKKKSKKTNSEVTEVNCLVEAPASAETEEKPSKKNKKKKKCSEEENQHNPFDEPQVANTIEISSEEDVPKKKKKKSRKTEEESIVENTNEEPTEQQIVSLETEEAPKKKKKNKKQIADTNESHNSSEHENAVSIVEDTNEENTNEELTEQQIVSLETEEAPKKKKKNKKQIADTNEPHNSSEHENAVSIVEEVPSKAQIPPLVETIQETGSAMDESLANPADDCNHKKSKKKKNKNKSADPPTPIEVSSLQQDLKSYEDKNLLDTYKISTFCAEKFRIVELQKFSDSNIAQINGYGFSENLELIISKIKNDEDRIMRLWNGTLDKYTHSTPKAKMYSAYKNKAYQVRKLTKRVPKLKIKSLKRAQVFQKL